MPPYQGRNFDQFTFPAQRFAPMMQRLQALQQRLQGMGVPPHVLSRLGGVMNQMQSGQMPQMPQGQMPQGSYGQMPRPQLPVMPWQGGQPGGYGNSWPGMQGINQAQNAMGQAPAPGGGIDWGGVRATTPATYVGPNRRRG